jgi:hypothetical protein
MPGRAPWATLSLIRDALLGGKSQHEVTQRLGVTPTLTRAVFAHLVGQGPEPDPCATCGGSGRIAAMAEPCRFCRGIGMTSPEA